MQEGRPIITHQFINLMQGIWAAIDLFMKFSSWYFPRKYNKVLSHLQLEVMKMLCTALMTEDQGKDPIHVEIWSAIKQRKISYHLFTMINIWEVDINLF